MAAAISSDSECEAASPVVGSSTAEIVEGVANFAFDGDVEEWVLCYKHGTNEWRLYADIIPASTPSAGSLDTAVSDTQRTEASVSFTLEGQIASFPEGSTARTTFLSAFVSDLARALRVDASRFTIRGMRAGSVVVEFVIIPTG